MIRRVILGEADGVLVFRAVWDIRGNREEGTLIEVGTARRKLRRKE